VPFEFSLMRLGTSICMKSAGTVRRTGIPGITALILLGKGGVKVFK